MGRSDRKHLRGDITLVLQTALSQLGRVEEIAEAWDGPLNVAVLLKHTDHRADVTAHLRKTGSHIAAWADMHLVFHYRDHDEYRMNTLRQLGVETVRTDLLLLSSLDLETTVSMKELKQDIEWARSDLVLGKEAGLPVYVLPTFTQKEPPLRHGSPWNASSLLRSVSVTGASLRATFQTLGLGPAKADFCFECSSPTHYGRWFDMGWKERRAYFIEPGPLYEPQMVAPQAEMMAISAEWDDSFPNRMLDAGLRLKARDLYKRGAYFVVLGHAYQVQLPPQRSISVSSEWHGFSCGNDNALGTTTTRLDLPKLENLYNAFQDGISAQELTTRETWVLRLPLVLCRGYGVGKRKHCPARQHWQRGLHNRIQLLWAGGGACRAEEARIGCYR